MNKAGRPRIFTKQQAQDITEQFAQGVPAHTLAFTYGCSAATIIRAVDRTNPNLRQQRKRGPAGTNIYRSIGDHVELLVLDGTGAEEARALLDAEDVPLVEKRLWRLNPKGYLQSHGHGHGNGRSAIYLHKLVSGIAGDRNRWTDHKNGNKLDNRKQNLRPATPTQSNINKRTKRGDLKGIHFSNKSGRWVAAVTRSFVIQEEAIAWRRRATELIYGEYAEHLSRQEVTPCL